jgi:hypothetical protein
MPRAGNDGYSSGVPTRPQSARSRPFVARALQSGLLLAPWLWARPVQAQPRPTPPVPAKMPSASNPSAAPAGLPSTGSPYVCEYGRVLVAGHCCWPGQGWETTAGRCVGQVAWCASDMVADPARGMNCLRVCRDGRLEMAPGHCCWKGQVWDPSAERCAAAVWQCPNDMVVTRSHMCRAADASCSRDEECSADSICRDGVCARAVSRSRFEVLGDLALGFSGYWTGSPHKWFTADAGWGFTVRYLKGLSLRWDWGAYLGYLSIPKKTYFVYDPPNNSYTLLDRMLRGGGLVRFLMVTRPKFHLGGAWEMGFLEFRAAAPFGLEGALDLFVDVPLTAGRHRLVATAAIGCRGGGAFRHESPDPYGYGYDTETWWISPMLRVGFGFGRW